MTKEHEGSIVDIGYAVADLIADRLIKDIAIGGARPQCWLFPGFPPLVVDRLIQKLLALPVESTIKVDQHYSDLATIPSNLFIKHDSESFTQFRHDFKQLTVLLPKDAHGEEWSSLDSVQTLDDADLLLWIEDFIDALPQIGEYLSEAEILGLKVLMDHLVNGPEKPDLIECLTFLLSFLEERKSGHLNNTALGIALPSLGSFRNENGFKRLSLEKLGSRDSSALKSLPKLLKTVIYEPRNYASHITPQGNAVSPTDMQSNLEKGIEDGAIQPENKALLSEFVNSTMFVRDARRQVLLLDWEIDGVHLLFKRVPKQRRKLGTATFLHLHLLETMDEAESDRVKELMEEVDNTSQYTDEQINRFREFYDLFRPYIAIERSLDQSWKKLLYQQSIVETEFLSALIQAVARLVPWTDNEERANCYPLRAKVLCEQTARDILEKLNPGAIRYFLVRYKGIESALAPAGIEMCCTGLQSVATYLSTNTNNESQEVQELFQKFIESSRPKKEANQLTFLAQILDKENNPIPELALRFAWVFPGNSFLSGLCSDLNRHATHPLSGYLLSRSLTSSKGVRPPLSLENAGCVSKGDNRLKGEIVPEDINAQSTINIKKLVKERCANLFSKGVLTEVQADKCLEAVNALETLLSSAYSAYLEHGLSWASWDLFVDKYGKLLEEFRSIDERLAYRESILTPITQIGFAEIRGTKNFIVSPLVPLRLVSLYVKAEQSVAVLSRWLSDSELQFVDRSDYLNTLSRDLDHPYYPEIASDEKKNLLTVSANLNEYSFMSVQEKDEDFSRRQSSDAKMAMVILKGILKDYLYLHPFEKNNCSVLAHSVSSGTFAQTLVGELLKASETELSGVKLRLFLHDNEPARLRSIYQEFLSNAELDADATDSESSFLARLGVSAMQKSSDLEAGDIDIAYLFDYIAERARIQWFEALESSTGRPSIEGHFPARWSKRQVFDRGAGACGSYLCCPVNPEPVESFYAAIFNACEPNSDSTELRIPARRVLFNQDSISNILRDAHRVARWVVNYDSILDRRLLQQNDINIIRYRPSVNHAQNLTISSTQQEFVVRDHLKRKLQQFGLPLSEAERTAAVTKVLEQSNMLSGELVLRAIGQGFFTNELLGAVLSKRLTELHLPSHTRAFSLWLYLDDFSTWFLNEAKLSGDLERPANHLADLVCVTAYTEDDVVRLHFTVTEAKVVCTAERHKSATKSAAQLRATMEKLKCFIDGGDYEDLSARKLRLGNLLVEAGERLQLPNACDPEELRWLLISGKIQPTLEGHSHIFCYDEDLPLNPEPLEVFDDAYQWRIGHRQMTELLKNLCDERSTPPEWSPLPSPLVPRVANAVDLGKLATENIPKPHTMAVQPSELLNDATPHQQDTALKESLLSEGDYIWATREIADLLASVQVPQDREDEDVLLQQLEATESSLRKLLPKYGIKADLGKSQITPNTFRIRLRGQYELTAPKLWKLKDPLLTIEGLSLIDVDTEPGFFAMAFARPYRSKVLYLECLKDRTVKAQGSNTAILIGQKEDTGGLLYYDFNQNQIPHALIGGMTGSGKSQLITTLIVDMMLTNTPDTLRLILVDPKLVEFAAYRSSPFVRNVPILASIEELAEDPIVRDPEVAVKVFQHLLEEMERRYSLFVQTGKKDITGYNQHVNTQTNPEHQVLPQLILIFDEVADWMLEKKFSEQVTVQFQRLAGKARAAGIHLIVATQRPDNTVLPMILRANLGAKIALQVDTEANSNIILDQGGAEKLLGNGHGIARLGGPRQFFQGAYISEDDRDMILSHLNHLYSSR